MRRIRKTVITLCVELPLSSHEGSHLLSGGGGGGGIKEDKKRRWTGIPLEDGEFLKLQKENASVGIPRLGIEVMLEIKMWPVAGSGSGVRMPDRDVAGSAGHILTGHLYPLNKDFVALSRPCVHMEEDRYFTDPGANAANHVMKSTWFILLGLNTSS